MPIAAVHRASFLVPSHVVVDEHANAFLWCNLRRMFIFKQQIPGRDRRANLMNHGEARRARRSTCAALLVMLRGAIHLELRLASQREAAAVNSHESLIAAYDPDATCAACLRRTANAAVADVLSHRSRCYVPVHCASLTMPHTHGGP